MRLRYFLLIAFLIISGISIAYLSVLPGTGLEIKIPKQAIVIAPNMNMASSAFSDGGLIPDKYTCFGDDVNPPLRVSSVPDNVADLVLIMDDIDTPDGVLNHWLVWNIDPKTAEINENNKPGGSTFGTNDFKSLGYKGPCPTSGTHRYYFRLYGLDSKVSLKEGSSRTEIDRIIRGHILAKDELIGKYKVD